MNSNNSFDYFKIFLIRNRLQVIQALQTRIEDQFEFRNCQFSSFFFDELTNRSSDDDLILRLFCYSFGTYKGQCDPMSFVQVTIDLNKRSNTKGNWAGKPLVTICTTASEVCSKRGMLNLWIYSELYDGWEGYFVGSGVLVGREEDGGAHDRFLSNI